MRKKVCGKHMEYNNSIVNQAGQIGYNIEWKHMQWQEKEEKEARVWLGSYTMNPTFELRARVGKINILTCVKTV
jgi:hypothetical protein